MNREQRIVRYGGLGFAMGAVELLGNSAKGHKVARVAFEHLAIVGDNDVGFGGPTTVQLRSPPRGPGIVGSVLGPADEDGRCVREIVAIEEDPRECLIDHQVWRALFRLGKGPLENGLGLHDSTELGVD